MSDQKKDTEQQNFTSTEVSIAQEIDGFQQQKELLEAQRAVLLNKAMHSNDPSAIVKAKNLYKDIEQRQKTERKSHLIDPLDIYQNMHYKDRPHSLSYGVLQRMSNAPIIKAIIKTRVNQVASFAEPQKDEFSTGFVIRKKSRRGFSSVVGSSTDTRGLNDEEKRKVYELTDFICNCGFNEQAWQSDDFGEFIRKLTNDSLTFDQATFEVIRNNKGDVVQFLATDASTYRISTSYDDNLYEERKHIMSNQEIVYNNFWGDKLSFKPIKGYYPSYIQIIDGTPIATFYPWELCFGVRNPDSSIYSLGYGRSELEDLIETITSILYADQYNMNFFKQGASPKGIIRVKGDVPENRLKEFRQQWQSMVAGVMNSWKTPVMHADEADWVDLQKTNRDMEFGKWQEYLIKIASAIFIMDPSEINFPISGSSSVTTTFGESHGQKVEYSKDKGLYPLLKFLQAKLNKFVIQQIDSEYELAFVGMDAITPDEKLKQSKDKVSTYMTLNEVRRSHGLEDVEYGDVVLNGTYLSHMQNQAMMEQQAQGVEAPAKAPEEASQETSAPLREHPLSNEEIENILDGNRNEEQQNEDSQLLSDKDKQDILS